MSARSNAVLEIALPYNDDLIEKIERGFFEKLEFDISFEVVESPSLLSGFIAYINGVVYDSSGKTLLHDMKKHLLDSVLAPPAPTKEADDQ